MDFSTREIATGIWLGIFLLFVLVKARSSLLQLIKAFFQPALLKIMGLMLAYVAGCVALLAWRGLWTTANLKTTILWVITVGMVRLFQANKIDEDERFFWNSLKETLAFTVIVEFLISTYTFSLWAELLLLPFLVFLTALTTVAKSQPGSIQVVTLIEWLLAIIGFWLLGHAAFEAIGHYHELGTVDTVRELILPILLSLMILPLLYALNIYMVYERIFIMLQFSIKDSKLRQYAKRRALLDFRADIDLLKRWRRLVNTDTPNNRKEVRALIAEVRETRRRERNPVPVGPKDGWSPAAAIHFLDGEGFKNEDYHRSFDTWASSSSHVKVTDPYSLTTMIFWVSGTRDVADLLKLRLHVSDSADAAVADERFGMVCGKLLLAAIGADAVPELEGQLGDTGEFEAVVAGYRISLKREDWSNKRGSYERRFVVRAPNYIEGGEGAA
jgi:hypothetical protein